MHETESDSGAMQGLIFCFLKVVNSLFDAYSDTLYHLYLSLSVFHSPYSKL